MRPPGFWAHGGAVPALLSPLAALYAAATARRLARPGWRAPVPVLCCGNAGAGGAGKTTVALDLGARLCGRGVAVAFLTRGHGGRLAGVRVDATHGADDVGDEALLLATVAPTYVDANRAEGARAALAGGARVLVMDDGLQNPGLDKTLSLLIVDGAAGFGNGHVMPAGPLRESVTAAASRCGAAVLIAEDATGALPQLPAGLPVLRAALMPGAGLEALAGRPVLAFAGIGRPAKFFAMLADAGVTLAATRAFPDHHRYRAAELDRLHAQASRLGACLATTPKDAARLSPSQRVGVFVVGVRLVWRDAAAVEALLDRLT